MRVLILLSLVCLAFANYQNLYTTCSTNGVRTSENTGNYWWWGGWYSSSYGGDAGSLNLPSNEHYAVPLDSTNTTKFYFNICGSTDICNGALACVIGESGIPDIFAYPNSEPYFYGNYESIEMQYYLNLASDSKYFYLSIGCGSSPFEIDYFYYYDDDEMQIDASSSFLCSNPVLTYEAPQAYTSLSGPIYMYGQLNMFTMDSISINSDGGKTEFIGNFYFSSTYKSFKINGTLSDNNGNSHDVSYVYNGNQPFENPALMTSEVYLPNSNVQSCVILPNSFDDDYDEVADWFSTGANPYMDNQRNYTSIYFQKGTSFTVDTWSFNKQYDQVFVNLMQRTSDNLPVSIGSLLLCPFVDTYSPSTFVSEIDWTNLDMSTLPESTFTTPSNCMA